MLNLQKDNITIREFTLADIDNKITWINDTNNNAYLHYDIPLSKEKTILWFNSKQKNRYDYVIEYKHIPVGLIGLINIDDNNKKAEFYICIGNTDFKRKGIATNATLLLLQFAFTTLNINKVYLNVDENNANACKLYEKIGFKREGRFIQDMVHKGVFINRLRYAILQSDFNK